jgi:hypothetical protein
MLIRTVLQAAPSLFSQFDLIGSLPSGGYRPFGTDNQYVNLLRESISQAPKYEYIHIRKEDLPVLQDRDKKQTAALCSLFTLVEARAKKDMAKNCVPFGCLTLRLLHYPPQDTSPTYVGSHYDFDYITYHLGSFKDRPNRAPWFSLNQEIMVGEMAALMGHAQATLHRGKWDKKTDRYALVAFAVPPSNYVMRKLITVQDYFSLTLENSRNRQLSLFS